MQFLFLQPGLHRPFSRATRRRSSLHVAVDAVDEDMGWAMRAQIMAPSPMQLTVRTGSSKAQLELSYASRTTSMEIATEVARQSRMSARFAAAPIGLENITLLAPAMTSNPFTNLKLTDPLDFHNFYPNIIPRSPAPDASPEEVEVFERIITPYDPANFFIELSRHNLLDRYPLLVRNLTKGFHLGRMPPILNTVIIPNHPSVAKHPEAVEEYIAEEKEAHRMSGPYTRQQLERIFGGPFVSAPFIVAESVQGPDKPPKLRVCRHLSKGGVDTEGHWVEPMNSFYDKRDFPTTVDSAAMIADWVSILLLSYP